MGSRQLLAVLYIRFILRLYSSHSHSLTCPLNSFCKLLSILIPGMGFRFTLSGTYSIPRTDTFCKTASCLSLPILSRIHTLPLLYNALPHYAN
ncbi:hypothetical protein CBFG_00005 [Clostridiales bacterium 1_7_47FAA]|nr:hypothetical protein CBFG_00005 [Clostridiales bacterium 1_7_47FAA]